MKLDENVCRGSLIIHCGVRYAVVSERPEAYRRGLVTYRGWRVVEITEAALSLRIDSVHHIAENEEVEMFFPGVAFILPDYIK